MVIHYNSEGRYLTDLQSFGKSGMSDETQHRLETQTPRDRILAYSKLKSWSPGYEERVKCQLRRKVLGVVGGFDSKSISEARKWVIAVHKDLEIENSSDFGGNSYLRILFNGKELFGNIHDG